MNNSIFAAIMIMLASICIFNKKTIEGFMEITGTNARHAYLPQSYKNNMHIRNFNPHGTRTTNDGVKKLESFSYNPKHIRNNIQDVEHQFNMIENFVKKNNMSSTPSYNQNTSPDLPKHALSETYIPKRHEYEHSKGQGITGITPEGYRNGASPGGGADLIRGNIFEKYTPALGLVGHKRHHIVQEIRKDIDKLVNLEGDCATGVQEKRYHKDNMARKQQLADYTDAHYGFKSNKARHSALHTMAGRQRFHL